MLQQILLRLKKIQNVCAVLTGVLMECNSTISESLTQIIHICLIALSGFQRSFKSMEVVVNAKHRNSEKNGLEINSLNRVYSGKASVEN